MKVRIQGIVIEHKINVQHNDVLALECDLNKLVKYAVISTMQNERADVPCVVNVLISDNAGIRRYNKNFRGIDKATDVLSFPMQVFQKPGWGGCPEPEFDEDSGELPLGDIVISMEKVEEQSVEYNNSIEYETAYLTVHSTLHLLGYDHDNEASEKVMHKKCENIMREMGFDTDDK